MAWLQAAVERVREFAYAERPAEAKVPARPKMGVALGGGFARGIAHLGVLHALEENGIPIDYISGTSAGALAGIAYASGLPFEEVVQPGGSVAIWHLRAMEIFVAGLGVESTAWSFIPSDYLSITHLKSCESRSPSRLRI